MQVDQRPTDSLDLRANPERHDCLDLLNVRWDGSDFLDPHHILAAWGSGTARWWRGRAAVFLAARPQESDYLGRATPAALAEQWDRLTARAEACENRALMADWYGPTSTDQALICGVAEALMTASSPSRVDAL